MRIAVIGSRDPSAYQVKVARDLINFFFSDECVCDGVREIATGAAFGIDYHAIHTLVELGEREKLHLYLPWTGYNAHLVPKFATINVYTPGVHKTWTESVYEHHPAPELLTRGAMALHARNFGIIAGSDIVVACPSDKLGGGGTGQGMRIAKAMRKPLLVVRPIPIDSTPNDWKEWLSRCITNIEEDNDD